MWGSHFLSAFCLLSNIWPLSVHLLSPFCPTYAPVLFLTTFCSPNSYFCPPLVQFFSPLSPFWPLFAHTSDFDFGKTYWTKSGQMLDPIFCSFTAWSPCNWTKPGQFQDTYNLKFVHLLPRYQIGQKWLFMTTLYGWTKSGHLWDSVQNMSWECPTFDLIWSRPIADRTGPGS